MKVIIAGSREIGDISVDAAVTASGFRGEIDEVVSGGALGVNRAGEEWAALSHIPVKIFLTDLGTPRKERGCQAQRRDG